MPSTSHAPNTTAIIIEVCPMRKSTLIILLTLVLTSCGRTQNIDDLKKKYILDDLSIYIENPLPSNDNSDRYSIDNKVYRINRKLSLTIS